MHHLIHHSFLVCYVMALSALIVSCKFVLEEPIWVPSPKYKASVKSPALLTYFL